MPTGRQFSCRELWELFSWGKLCHRQTPPGSCHAPGDVRKHSAGPSDPVACRTGQRCRRRPRHGFTSKLLRCEAHVQSPPANDSDSIAKGPHQALVLWQTVMMRDLSPVEYASTREALPIRLKFSYLLKVRQNTDGEFFCRAVEHRQMKRADDSPFRRPVLHLQLTSGEG